MKLFSFLNGKKALQESEPLPAILKPTDTLTIGGVPVALRRGGTGDETTISFGALPLSEDAAYVRQLIRQKVRDTLPAIRADVNVSEAYDAYTITGTMENKYAAVLKLCRSLAEQLPDKAALNDFRKLAGRKSLASPAGGAVSGTMAAPSAER